MASHGIWAFQYSLPLIVGAICDMTIGEFKSIIVFGFVTIAASIVLTYSALFPTPHFIVYSTLVVISLSVGALKPVVFASTSEPESTPESCGAPLPFSARTAGFIIQACIVLSTLWSPIFIEIPCLGKKTCYPLSFGLSTLLLGFAMLLFLLTSHHFTFNRSSDTYRSLVHMISSDFKKKIRRTSQDNIGGLSSSTQHLQTTAAGYDMRAGSSANPVTSTENGSVSAAGTATCTQTNILTLFDDHDALRTDFHTIIQVIRALSPFVIFWMLYDQQFTTWIEQALNMHSIGEFFSTSLPSFLSIYDNLLMIALIPLVALALYPLIKIFCKVTSVEAKIVTATAVASISFFTAAAVQYRIEYVADKVAFLFQLPQFLLMAIAELILGMTENRFINDECPARLRGIAVILWLFLVGLANLLLVLFKFVDPLGTVLQTKSLTPNYIFFGFLGVCGAFLFHWQKKIRIQRKRTGR